jgi:hypothetical protein
LLAYEHDLAGHFTYRDLERFICKTICFVPQINLTSFFWFILNHTHRISNADGMRFDQEALPEFIRMRDATARDALIIMVLNSPWEIILSSGVMFVLWILGKLSRILIYRRAETFVESLAPDSAVRIPAAC